MALTKASQTPQAAASNGAGGTTTGAWLPVNYGVSGVATITNGGTGPTVGCDFVVEVADDNLGTNVVEWSRQTAPTTNAFVTTMPFGLGIGGNGGDYAYYRTKFTGNTGQAVTVAAAANTVTAL